MAEFGETNWTTVPIDLGGGGLDLRPNQAQQPPDVLTEAVNLRYRNDHGLNKRNGHEGGPILANASYVDVELSPTGSGGRDWLYGRGDTELEYPDNQFYLTEQRVARGLTTRDGVPLVWTGDRLFEFAGSDRWTGSSTYWYRAQVVNPPLTRGVPCYLPTAEISRVDQTLFPSNTVDRTIGLKYSVTVVQGAGTLSAQIQDLNTGAWVARSLDLLQGVTHDPAYVTVVFTNNTFVVYYADATSGLIHTTSMHEAQPLVWTTPVARANGQKFDVELIGDTLSLLVWRDPADSKIKGTYFHGDTPQGAPFGPGTVLVASGATNGVAVSAARTGDLGLVWVAGTNIKAQVLLEDGAAVAASFNLATLAAQYLTVTSRLVEGSSGASQFVAYYHLSGRTEIKAFESSGVLGSQSHAKYNCYPASRAFTVGDETFCWLVHVPSTNSPQSCYFLIGGTATPLVVGACARSTARITDDHLPGVRRSPHQQFRYTCAMPENTRSDGNSADIRPLQIDLNFTPSLRAAEYGKAVYFAAALPQVYDGRETVEAGFLAYPETTGVASANNVGGGLVPGDIRQYRVYAVHRNSSGETTRSPALTFTAPAVGMGNNSNVVTFTPIPCTSRIDAWFEVYATQNGGGVFYLTSPALAGSAPANTFLAATKTFTDLTSDALLAARPIDPFQPVLGGLSNLETQSPPGCTNIFSARDRLWFSGGDVPQGAVAFSKLRQELVQAGWSDEVGLLAVDHLGGKITALGETGDSLVVFLRDRLWAQPGEGPDNLGGGGFDIPTLVRSGVGAVAQEGTVQTPKGLAFWSDSGPRVLSDGYQVLDLSHRVYPLTTALSGYVTGAVSVPGQEEVRWYTNTGTALVWDHRFNERNPMGRWSQWDGLAVAGAVYYPGTGYPLLVTTDGRWLLEDPSGVVRTDAGVHYAMSWATPELRPGELVQGHNRFRRFSLRGEYRGPHTLGIWMYYDGSPLWTAYREWVTINALVSSGWGDADDGGTAVWNTDNTAWIDPSNAGARIMDGTYRLRDRLSRQPGATLKMRFSDLGAPNDTALIEELALELGVKPGLTRLPDGSMSSPTTGTVMQGGRV